MDVDLDLILRRAEERLSIDLEQIGELKGVKKLMSRNRVCEPIEKGILRAYHGISTNKDGTARFDMTDIPITHFRPEEIGGVSRERLQELGYRGGDGILELYPQDIIIPRQAAEYLLRVARFVDDLLVKYYGMEPYYMCESADDLIGHLVIGLAPHTSGGIVGRIIGFSDVSACYAHPPSSTRPRGGTATVMRTASCCSWMASLTSPGSSCLPPPGGPHGCAPPSADSEPEA